ncbi:MAG: hypothetical protein CM15mP111_4600 [Hyphomicrobiales bacterium]|nr:MAG: hypothetical protein CM15mP111_4600 [Hyphomicrobiales bacterium]
MPPGHIWILERFTGILIEHYAALSLWVSPLSRIVTKISRDQYAKMLRDVYENLRAKQIPIKKISYKIRGIFHLKFPNIFL